ncbi:MAG TPA: electron transfer flavoprotein subunit alpha/FixB family protein [bacterium]|nr:electron transfer flavoprotein subunit alpha/FixB family protein [bacterium]
MNEILVLAEHRNGELTDITFEMLGKAGELAGAGGATVAALLLGAGVGEMAQKLTGYADEVLTVDHGNLTSFNSAVYQPIVAEVVKSRGPSMVLIGNTAFGVDLAPSLAVELDAPLASDVVGIVVDGDTFSVTRQIYEGKIDARVSFREAPTVLATVRAAAFPVEPGTKSGSVTEFAATVPEEPAMRRFVEYVEAAVGDVDISASEVIVAVGRGIKEEENMALVEELAELLGGVVGCSRPIVDAGWLPKDRQVGSSGKTVKPKLYVAVGISGQFQHLSGMKAAETIVAINKDPKAPIFSAADYGIVGDLFKIVPALKDKIAEVRA